MILDLALYNLAAFCAARGVAAWLVGGAVRDLALGRTPTDLDLAVAGDGLALARAYADAVGAAFVPLDDERLTGRVVLPGPPPLTIDLATLRAPTIEGDLRLRDFTLNALALPLSTQHAALSTQHFARRTQHSPLGPAHAALGPTPSSTPLAAWPICAPGCCAPAGRRA